jgi:hypothetical protein
MTGLHVFYGEANPAQARIYAQIPAESIPVGTYLAGTVVGPFCKYSRTLSASVPMIVRNGRDGALLEAIVPDPCFWTPDLPMIYRVELRVGEATVERTLGIRPLGTRGRQLLLNAENWVLRGFESADDKLNWNAWREAGLACLARNVTTDFVAAASERGILTIATSDEFAGWPAVGLVLMRHESNHQHMRNVLKAQAFNATDNVMPIASAQVAMVEVNDPLLFAHRAKGCTIPVIACRRHPEIVDVVEARKACDTLQRDLAGLGHFAGYVILRSEIAE